MSRRPSTPPSSSANNQQYLNTINSASGFKSISPPTYSANSISNSLQKQSSSEKGSSPSPSPSGFNHQDLVPIHSNPFARPDPPSEVQYNWGEDAASTIAPDDSVSQLDRRFTGKRTLNGPRALPSSSLQQQRQQATIAEEEHEVESYGWVDPNSINNNNGGAGNGNGDGTIVGLSGRAVPRTTGEYGDPYDQDQDQDQDPDSYGYRHQHSRSSGSRGMMMDVDPSSSSANIPLVSSAAPMAGGAYAYEQGSGSQGGGGGGASIVKPYQGYAAVGKQDESEGEEYDDGYAAYSRTRDGDLERAVRDGTGTTTTRDKGGIRGVVGSGIASAFSGSLGYVKSLRSGGSGKGDDGDHKEERYGEDEDSYYNNNSAATGTYPPTQVGRGTTNKDLLSSSDMKPAPTLLRLLYDTTPTPIRIEEHKRGVGVQRHPWACWTLSVVMTVVLVVELVRMAKLTGSPIQTKPSFNVMIGPSGSVLIDLGARFAGCMKFVTGVSDIDWVCLANSNSATITASEATCTMSDICGFGGFPTASPNQSFRFFVPIFLHAGIVHIILNLLAQCVSAAQVERQMGTPKFLLVYFPAGIFGFVLGANFALVGQPSVGASGAIFGTHAAILVDLLAHWGIEYRPKRKLFYLILEIVVGLALGLVPGVDNFAHIGGFAMGLLMSIILLPIIHQTRLHMIVFIVIRCIAAPLVFVMFIVLIKNFYDNDPAEACEWCRYLSCWPTASNNHCKGTGLETISSTSSIWFGTLVAYLITFVPALL
ncbi:rhomboid-domain-containing protein [Meredithblackwellia eburnea MCA 4105]